MCYVEKLVIGIIFVWRNVSKVNKFFDYLFNFWFYIFSNIIGCCFFYVEFNIRF